MLFKSKRGKMKLQKNVTIIFILFFTCNNLFSEKITDYVNKKDVQNVNKIFIYREEKKQKKEDKKYTVLSAGESGDIYADSAEDVIDIDLSDFEE